MWAIMLPELDFYINVINRLPRKPVRSIKRQTDRLTDRQRWTEWRGDVQKPVCDCWSGDSATACGSGRSSFVDIAVWTSTATVEVVSRVVDVAGSSAAALVGGVDGDGEGFVAVTVRNIVIFNTEKWYHWSFNYTQDQLIATDRLKALSCKTQEL